MKALVIYDSKYGNTKLIAETIAETLGGPETVRVVPALAVDALALEGIDLLAIGGPTQGHGLSPNLRTFLDNLPSEAVKDLPTVAFDTRLTWPRILSGSAAEAAAKRLEKKGARLLMPPESFLVEGGEGPLVDGELDRAEAWANEIHEKAGLPQREPVSATSGGQA